MRNSEGSNCFNKVTNILSTKTRNDYQPIMSDELTPDHNELQGKLECTSENIKESPFFKNKSATTTKTPTFLNTSKHIVELLHQEDGKNCVQSFKLCSEFAPQTHLIQQQK